MLCAGEQCFYWDLINEDVFTEASPLPYEERRKCCGRGIATKEGLWVTGGYNSDAYELESTFYVGLNEVTRGPDLPDPLRSHCVVRINSSRIMIAGGMNDEHYFDYLSESHYYDEDTKKWSGAQTLSSMRAGHSCSMLTLSGKPYLVVAGGSSCHSNGMPYSVDTVEFLEMDTDKSSWIEGLAITLFNQS